MAIPKVAAVCLSGVVALAGAEARLNTPTLDPRSWIPMVDEILLTKVGPPHLRTTTPAPGEVTTTTTKMPPSHFFQALAENLYLSKLLLAAEHGIHVPLQHLTLTNPVDLINSIPFPFSLVSNGLKRAALAAGLDLQAFQKAIENSYVNKHQAMIDHGILPPSVLAQAVQELDPQTFMAFLPALDQEYVQSLRQFLPASLAEIPSIQEVMGAFNVEEGSPAEATLRSLFPFFDVETLESYMRMAADGLPLPQLSSRSEETVEGDETASFRMWIPLLDDALFSKIIPLVQSRESDQTQTPANAILELAKAVPFSDLLGL